MKIILRILFTAIGVLLASQLVSGIFVDSFWTAVLVAVVLAILNVVIGIPLKLVTAPISIITFGLFLLVINALVFWMASFVKGFVVSGFWPALWGSVIVTVISMAGKVLIKHS